MCSIVEDDCFAEEPKHLMPADPVTTNKDVEICSKCKITSGSIKLKHKNLLCTDCFLNYIRHKFRAILGSTKIVKRNSNVLLSCDSDIKSTTLLHMIQEAVMEPSHKRLNINLTIVYFDEFHGQPQRYDRIIEFREILKDQYNNQFKCYYLSLYQPSEEDNLIDINTVNPERFQQIHNEELKQIDKFKSIKTPTIYQDHLTQTRRRKLIDLAEKLECSFIFLPEVGIDLATNLISNIALGRGASAAYNNAFCDDREVEVKIIRPFKDFDNLEIFWYAEIKKLKYFEDMKKMGNSDTNSIQGISSKFVNGLQEKFSSTITTICRTGDKIAPKTSETRRCSFCKSILDVDNCETLRAIEFSRLVSGIVNHRNENELDNLANNYVNENDDNLIRKNLCHACKNIFIEFDDD